VSLIGNLEQLSLPEVLQQIEAQGKTGLLIVKQGILWVEFYFKQGWLMCVGPVRTTATLGERLVQTGMISEQAWQEAKRKIGAEPLSEIHIASTLFDLGFVGQEELRAWSTQRAAEVIQAILCWTQGEIYFEEQILPPADRLQVAIIASSLLPAPPPPRQPAPVIPLIPQTDGAPKHQNSGFLSGNTGENSFDYHRPTPMPAATLPKTNGRNPYSTDISNVPTLLDPSQFLDETPTPIARSLPAQNTDNSLSALPALPSLKKKEVGEIPSTPLLNKEAEAFIALNLLDGGETPAPPPPTPVRAVAGEPINISLMHPDMILVEVEALALLEQKVELQITPDQWRMLRRVDGQTSLRNLCQEFGMPPEQICQIAGELVLLGLIQLVLPGQATINAMSPLRLSEAAVMRPYNGQVGFSRSGSREGYDEARPYGSMPTSTPLPSTTGMLAPNAIPPLAPPSGLETESQWGNGGNGATFITGRGWVVKPQPLRPLSASGPIAVTPSVQTQPPYAYPTGMKSGVF
jgi:hypothetical protein